MRKICWLLIFACLSPLLLHRSVVAQEVLSVKIVVNSDRDGAIIADDFLTLREAIEIVNGTLPQKQLSSAEKALVTPLQTATFRINFNLPSTQTTIRLTRILPPLLCPVVLDGTTQAGYPKSSNPKNFISAPVIAIASETNIEIFCGLTVAASNVTIRGLSLYGFTAKPQSTLSTPPADIFIADSLTVSKTSQEQQLYLLDKTSSSLLPQRVVIEDNWLGTPSRDRPVSFHQNLAWQANENV